MLVRDLAVLSLARADAAGVLGGADTVSTCVASAPIAEDLDHFLQVVSTILSFFLTAMVCPEVQAKAQDELDRVIGRDKLPTLDDRKDLPYVECILWECLRWNPGGPDIHVRRP